MFKALGNIIGGIGIILFIGAIVCVAAWWVIFVVIPIMVAVYIAAWPLTIPATIVLIGLFISSIGESYDKK